MHFLKAALVKTADLPVLDRKSGFLDTVETYFYLDYKEYHDQNSGKPENPQKKAERA